MAEAFLKDQKRLLPCAAYVNDLYDLEDIFLGVPVIIGSKGVEKVVEIKLNESEKKEFNNSILSVKNLIKACKKIDESLN